jgi:hypothetical protein
MSAGGKFPTSAQRLFFRRPWRRHLNYGTRFSRKNFTPASIDTVTVLTPLLTTGVPAVLLHDPALSSVPDSNTMFGSVLCQLSTIWPFFNATKSAGNGLKSVTVVFTEA